MNLQNHFLIATPQMPDPRFRQTVVYICAHTHEGAMGLVVNQPVEHLDFADIIVSDLLDLKSQQLPTIHLGGPMELETGFFLYSAEYKTKQCLEISETVALSRDQEILLDICRGRGPQKYIFLIGYAGWAPGQLESELKMNGWLTIPANDEILFETPDALKWQRAAKEYGIDIKLFGDVIGNA